MKGIVFSFINQTEKSDFSLAQRIKYLLMRYGVCIVLFSVLLSGLALGAFYAGNADPKDLKSLDFLFTTNLDARLSQGPFGTFKACLASDFIFIFSVYLLGLTPWGIPVVFLAAAFKGFGTGLTAGYLCVSYNALGMGFYVLVLLPGAFLFCMTFVLFGARSLSFSKRMFTLTFRDYPEEASLKQEALAYSARFLSALAVTFVAASLDTLLWTAFAGAFNFS